MKNFREGDLVSVRGEIVGEGRASNILSDLYNERGAIEPVGAARGRGVRYKLAS